MKPLTAEQKFLNRFIREALKQDSDAVKATVAMARGYLPSIVRELVRLIHDPKVAPADKIDAAELLFDRGIGALPRPAVEFHNHQPLTVVTSFSLENRFGRDAPALDAPKQPTDLVSVEHLPVANG